MKRQVCLLLLLAIFLAATASYTEAVEPTATPEPTPTPAEYLDAAAEAMTGIESVQFSLSRNGSPVVIEPTLGAVLVSASGEYQAPDRVHAEVKADLSGNILALDLLWLPEGNFMSNPLTGAYMEQPAELAVNPAAMFDPASGISRVLAEEVNNPAMVGMETVEGVESRHISGTVDAGAVEFLSPVGLTGELGIDFWLESSTDLVVRIQITEPAGDQTALDLFAYNEPVEIAPPG